MRIRARSIVIIVALCWGVLAFAAESASPDQAQQIQALQKQVEALTQELAKVQTGTNPQAQQQAMQSHWSMMQNHMQSMRQWPGMNPTGCSDWMMMDPSMMGPGMMGGGMMDGCWDHGTGTMGHGMMGGGMMGGGMMGQGGWALPNETPAQYQKRMQTLQQDMRKQMAAIAAETDPTKRDALIRQHYETMYRNMQTMRGMGWMWTQGTASAFPDASSPGATLESKYCSQCHSAPPPDVHTAKEWADVTGRMQQHIGDQATTNGGVMVPSASEMASIVEYLDKHAKPGG
jgi:hypothetical protein